MSQNQIAELLVDSKCILAEGIQWNEIENRLYWCDIHGAKLWSSDEDGGNITILDLPDRIGSFAFDKDGNLLIAFVDGLYKMKAGTTDRELIEKIDENNPVTRLNDGRCDRQGRFVVGGMDEENFQPLSQVFQYDGHTVKIFSNKCVLFKFNLLFTGWKNLCISLIHRRGLFENISMNQKLGR